MKSIRTRLTLFFLLICVGCLAIAMAVSSIFSRSALADTNDRLHEQQAEYYASMIDSWLQENTSDVDAACTFLEAKSLIDEETIRPVMEQYTNNNVNAMNVNVGFENKMFIDGTGWKPEAGWDCTGRPWYTDAKAAGGEKYFGDPYVDAVTGELIISVSKMFHTGSGMEGVVNMDLKLSTLFDMMSEITDTSDGSYSFIYNENGAVLMHPNSEFISTGENVVNVSDLIGGAYEKAMTSQRAFTDYDGKEKYLKAATVAGSGWKEVLVTPVASYNSAANEMLMVLVAVTVLSAVIAAVLVILYAGSITKPILKIQKQINHLQELNLKEIDIKENRQKDELGRMNHDVLELQKTLGHIIQQMGDSSTNLSEQYDIVNSSVSTLLDNNVYVKNLIDEVLSAVSEEADQIQTANMSLNDFAKDGINHAEYKTFLTLLNPVAPHITEEIWQACGFEGHLYQQKWPEFEEAKTIENTIELPVQINGKTKAVVKLPLDVDKESAIAAGKEAIADKLTGTIVKEIYVPKKIINIVQK